MSKQAMKYKELGNAEFKKGNMQAAIENYCFAVEIDPRNPIFRTNRAAAYEKIGKWDKCLRDANKSIALDSKWVKGYWRKGNALMALGDAQGAMDAYKVAAQIKPDSDLYKSLVQKAKKDFFKGKSEAFLFKEEGNVLFKAGKYEDAIKFYTKGIRVLDLPADNAVKVSLLCNRAACNQQLYQPKKVITDCTGALELEPNNVKALLRRAQCFEAVEKWQQALDDFQKVSILTAGSMKVAAKGCSRLRQAIKNMNK